ncbi:MAG TPA: aminotransferase class V-fold PLP-dependent enzyme [Conexibacter sp.]|jgi:selenocysteine lyase/cysteine desulfurase|nr:aminotransferase class V-fold PLP-dependent enzyme [Conexibacter sp.]
MSGTGTPLAALRAQFPVLEQVAYLNAGTNGPVPRAATVAACAQLEREQAGGRGGLTHFERREQLAGALRAAYAERLGCPPADLALTTSTTEGVARVLLALDLRAGDEIVTSDEEHPGVLGPLAAQRARGVVVRTAPWVDVADAVGPRTRLVVCSHVSWRSGRFAPAGLAQLDVPVLLDGAQGAGAVPVDVAALGADAYAAAGQKWLCGPEGTGLLFVSEALRERMRAPAPGYVNLADPGAGLDAVPHADARAYDAPVLAAASLAQAGAALDVLGGAGWDAVHAHAADLAATAADALRDHGRDVLPRDRTTLVTWREPDAPAVVERLAAADVVVRSLPGEDLLRASVGAWSSADDLDRLLVALPA